VQGSWNYQTLIGTGFAYMLLPALRHQLGDDPAALRSALARHAELFNSHPYLATLAAGAVARLEADHAGPELIKRFKDALRAPLGSIGDRLFWLAWRPTCALGAITLLLLGLPWWVAAAGFVAAYNAVHLYVRHWGLDAGLATGLQVGAALRDASLERWGNRAGSAGALLAGFATVLASARVERASFDLGVVIVAVGVGLLLRGWTRRLVWSVLAAGWFAGVTGMFAAFG
jgi:PTS system mannose-specific IID component